MAAHWSPGQNSLILKLLQVQESDFFSMYEKFKNFTPCLTPAENVLNGSLPNARTVF